MNSQTLRESEISTSAEERNKVPIVKSTRAERLSIKVPASGEIRIEVSAPAVNAHIISIREAPNSVPTGKTSNPKE